MEHLAVPAESRHAFQGVALGIGCQAIAVPTRRRATRSLYEILMPVPLRNGAAWVPRIAFVAMHDPAFRCATGLCRRSRIAGVATGLNRISTAR